MCLSGSVLIDKISVCDDVIIGAGSVVIKNITESGTYVGNPARKVK
jgi:UDP-N-acetylbacillosamine N-acetyltransferase